MINRSLQYVNRTTTADINIKILAYLLTLLPQQKIMSDHSANGKGDAISATVTNRFSDGGCHGPVDGTGAPMFMLFQITLIICFIFIAHLLGVVVVSVAP